MKRYSYEKNSKKYLSIVAKGEKTRSHASECSSKSISVGPAKHIGSLAFMSSIFIHIRYIHNVQRNAVYSFFIPTRCIARNRR